PDASPPYLLSFPTRRSSALTPVKPLEAMAMGLPMIASDFPALRELVAPGERGEVFSPGDSTALAQLILDLIDNESDRDRYALSGDRKSTRPNSSHVKISYAV